MNKRPLFEVCLQSVEDALAAEAGGAGRAELCAALVEGGITPDRASLEATLSHARIPVMVMVRPRGGDFLYSSLEFKMMLATVAHCRELGAHGVVFGLLNSDGSLASTQVQELVAAAGSMETTFHRAFDVCANLPDTMEELVDLGVTRILTSGGAATAPAGAATIRNLIEQADGRIGILPGSGITPDNLTALLERTGATEFHATAFETRQSSMKYRNEAVYMGIPGLPEYERQVTSAVEVRRFLDRLA